MRKLGAATLAAWLASAAPVYAQAVGPTNTILCNKTASASPATATTTSLIAGVAGHQYQICGWHVTSNQSGVSTFQLEHGTQGGPCSSPAVDTPAFTVTSTAPSADHVEYASWSIPTGAQLCVVTTGGTVGMQVMIFYADLPTPGN
jgi:hypothetical protein